MTKSVEEQIADIERQMEQLRARKQRIKARENAKARKRRTHLIIQLGGILANDEVLGYSEDAWGDEANRQKLLGMLKAHGGELRADHVALDQVGDHGDVPVAPAAGLVDADRLHARVVLVQARLPHVVRDEPPRAGVVLAGLFGDIRDGPAFRRFHDHRLGQERGRRRPDAPTAPALP